MNTAIPSWRSVPEEVRLAENDVHVWLARLDMPITSVDQFRQILSPEETAKSQRFYFDKDRHYWIVARGLLRTILGRYTHSDPTLICFGTNDYGKPALTYPVQYSSLQFNISHSGDLALYAFTRRKHIGVDVEYMRVNVEYDEVAKHTFSGYEQEVLRNLLPEKKRQAFYNCWTRKEAYVKARGMGLSLPLDLFDVSLLPGEPAALLQSREDPREVERWSMRELAPGPDYAGALAVEGKGWRLHCLQWSH